MKHFDRGHVPRFFLQDSEHGDQTMYSMWRREGIRPVPAWANRFYIAEAYRLARIRTAATGIKHVVDHIVPLQSPLVCGLHVEANLQVIPESINASKGNRWWKDMPEELWLHP